MRLTISLPHGILSIPVSMASLVAQLVKNPPAMQETWARSLEWEDPLEKEMTTHSSILAMDRGALRHTVYGAARVGHDLVSEHTHGSY